MRILVLVICAYFFLIKPVLLKWTTVATQLAQAKSSTSAAHEAYIARSSTKKAMALTTFASFGPGAATFRLCVVVDHMRAPKRLESGRI